MDTLTGPQQTIGARYPTGVVEAVRADAERLDLTVSQYMNAAVTRMLKAKITPEAAGPYRQTFRAKRSDADKTRNGTPTET